MSTVPYRAPIVVRLLAIVLAAVAGCSRGDDASSTTQPGATHTPTQLVITSQPSNTTAGVTINPAMVVAVEDAQGHVVESATNTVTLALGANPGSATLIGTLTAPAVNGVATFSALSLNKAGASYTLAATASGLTGVTSSAFSVAAAPASQLAFTVQPSTSWPGTLLSPTITVTVQDAFGNPVTAATNSIALALGANPGGATLSGTLSVAAASGVASFGAASLDVGGAGYTLVASAAGLASATSAAFTVNRFLEISVGTDFHACALTTGGVVSCWGNNGNGQLVNGTLTNSSMPVTIAAGRSFSAVSSGSLLSCGVTSLGAAYCWGDDLGAATYFSHGAAAVPGGFSFVTVGTGDGAACGITAAGAGYCWGDNSDAPVPVAGSLTLTTVSSGDATCALTTTGAAYCWGDNTFYEFGNGTTTNSSVPVPVSGGLTFASISASEGGKDVCGVTPLGVAYCWGYNYAGALGNGTFGSGAVPGPVSGGLTFATVSAGWDLTCGLTTGGAAYCWGDNSDGQLGTGTTTLSSTPVPVAGNLKFAAVSAGQASACGITTAGAAYCWGRNAVGQLGNGTLTSSSIPVRVTNPH